MFKNKRNRRGKKNGARQAAQGPSMARVQVGGVVARNLPLFGYRTRRIIPYFANVTFNTGTSVANAYVFSGNGCFDPDVTGTGGQPMGFDQMMTFYNHYTVINAKIVVELSSSSTTLYTVAGLLVSGSSTVTTSVEQLMENGDCAFVTLGFAGQQGSTAKFERRVSAAKFQGIDDVMDDPNMRGDSASNPTEQFYFHVFAYALGSSSTLGVYAQARIEYDVMFHEPRKGSLSLRALPNDPPVGERKECQSVLVHRVPGGQPQLASALSAGWSMAR
jgi:hypothetical protein